MIPPFLFSIREVPQVSASCAPFELVYSHALRGLLNIICEGWETEAEEGTTPQAITNFQNRLKRAQAIAQENLGHRQEKQKQHYDAQATEQELKVGNWVLVLLPDNLHKLLARWQGLFQMTRHTGPVNYEVLQMEPTWRRQINHINLLKKWRRREGVDPVKLKELEGDREIWRIGESPLRLPVDSIPNKKRAWRP